MKTVKVLQKLLVTAVVAMGLSMGYQAKAQNPVFHPSDTLNPNTTHRPKTADFNNDGAADLVLAHTSTAALEIRISNGNGTFQAPVSVPTVNTVDNFNSFCTGDFNGDSNTDIAVACAGSYSIILGNGNGTFQNAVNTVITFPTYLSYEFASIGAGDFNNDSQLDLALGGNILSGNGDGTFNTHTTNTPVATLEIVEVTDLNNDGNADLVLSKGGNSAIRLGDGTGVFTSSPVPSNMNGVVRVADLNNDGNADLVSFGNNATYVTLGNGDATFQTLTYYPGGLDIEDITIADLNEDNILDIAIADVTGVSVILGNGDGTFEDGWYDYQVPTLRYTVAIARQHILVADFNGDNKADILSGGSGNSLHLMPYQGAVAEPVVAASNLTASNTTSTSTTLNWTNGDGSARIVVARPASPITQAPYNGLPFDGSHSSYFTVGNTYDPYPGDHRVVYNGTGNTTTVTGLDPNTTYHFAVFEYNNENTGNFSNRTTMPNYKTDVFPQVSTSTPVDSQLVFDIQTVTGGSGVPVDVPVTIENFSNVGGFQFDIHYPTSKGTFVSLENVHSSLNGLDSNSYNDLGNGTVRVFWTDPMLNAVSLTDGEQLFTIRLNVTAPSGDTLAITMDNIMVFDNAAGPIAADSDSGLVIVDMLVFRIDPMTAITGTTVDIPVTVNNFLDVSGFQYSIQVPTNKATFVSLDNFNSNLAGLDATSYFDAGNGTINLLWSEPNLSNVSLADGEQLFTIRLQVTTPAVDSFEVHMNNIMVFDNLVNTINAREEVGMITVIDLLNVSGQVYTFDYDPIRDVVLTMDNGSTPATETTGADGRFSFTDLPMATYTLTPAKDINATNGLNVADIILIRRHIMGVQSFSIPYHVIAADLDFSDDVNIADVMVLQSLILQSQTILQKSWRFVPAGFNFPNPANPFSSTFPESIAYNNLSSDQTTQDFVGVKIGDVNDDSNPQAKRSGIETALTLAQKEAFPGSIVSVPVSVDQNYTSIAGWQGTISFDDQVLEFAGVEAGALPVSINNFSFHDTIDAYSFQDTIDYKVNFLYAHPAGQEDMVADDDILFTLQFKVIGGQGSQSAVEINSSGIPTAIFDGNLQRGALKVANGTVEVVDTDIDVFPNPGRLFNMDLLVVEEGPVRVQVIDMLGRTVMSQTATYNSGRHQLQIDAQNWVKGFYVLQLEADGISRSKKLIVE